MIDEVKICVDAKVNYFEEYFLIPDNFRGEMERFVQDTVALGERCGSASEFEQQFVASGLSDRFNALIPRCTPKARKMTKEEKQQSKRIARDIMNENRGEIAKDAFAEASSRVLNDERDRLIEENRQQMIKDGTAAEHTIMKNRIDDAGGIARFIGGIFKKKG